MDYDHIPILLDKYFEGNTSLAEEKQLRSFFQQEQIPEELSAYQELFQWQVGEQEVRLSADFQDRLLSDIEGENQGGFIRRFLQHPMSRAAAILLLLTGMWWAYQIDTQSSEIEATAEINWDQYQPQTPEEALSITRNAMIMISKELNRGTARVAKEVVKVRQLGKVD